MLPIAEFCEQLKKKYSDISAAEMLHALHLAGYEREESVLQVKALFPALTADEMCRIIVNEYINPLIEKKELCRLLLLCGYSEDSANAAVEFYYPKPLGFILMLDDSYSMKNVGPMIKIDAKAFLDCSRTGDQFGVNIFASKASWLYPSDGKSQPATVSEERNELKEAKACIENLTTNGDSTNIGDAIALGNAMLENLKTDKKAYVLISDGLHNQGIKPELVLQDEPPIYIAGLGSYMKETYFTELLKKNKKSKFYNSPTAYTMMQIFNQILADSSDSMLRFNNLHSCSGSDYNLQEFTISGQGNSSLISVVWSNKKYSYTAGMPEHDHINLILIDPKGQQTAIQPKIIEEGFCIYDLRNVRPGVWKILSQYSVSEPVTCTVGVIETGVSEIVEIKGVQVAEIGENVPYQVCISQGSGLKNLVVETVCSRPTAEFSIKHTSQSEMSMESSKEKPCSFAAAVPRLQTFEKLTKQNNTFMGNLNALQHSGICNMFFTVRGQYSDGTPFVCQKMHSVMVK